MQHFIVRIHPAASSAHTPDFAAGCRFQNMGCGPSQARVLSQAPISSNPDEFFPYQGSGPWHTSRADSVMQPRLAKSGPASSEDCPPVTLQELLKKAAEEKGDKLALKVERPCPSLGSDGGAPPAFPDEEWKAWTYREYYDESRQAARGFMKLGFEAFDTLAIWGFNTPEWLLSALAAGFAGGKVGGLYPTGWGVVGGCGLHASLWSRV